MKLMSPFLCVIMLSFSHGLTAQVPSPVTSSQPLVSDSEEMKAIFIADQFDRGNNPYAKKGDPQPPSLPGPEIRKNDDVRESKVKALLQAGTIKTGTDFFRAALVFSIQAHPTVSSGPCPRECIGREGILGCSLAGSGYPR